MSALGGVRVLEVGRVPPLELPGMMLGDMGADVVKIDMPPTEATTPAASRLQRHSHTNRNKRSIALNLKSKDGLAIFRQLAAGADVLVEGFRPGVMQRLGAGYEELAPGNPRLVYCSMSGFGQGGPYRDRPAHDLNFLALSGALSLWGRPGGSPDVPLNLVADYGGAAMHATLAIAFALLARHATGRGQYIDIAYLDSTIALLAATPNLRHLFPDGHQPAAGEGVFCGGYPYYGTYAARDGELLAVACSEPHLWRNFCVAIGRRDLSSFSRSAAHYTRGPDREEVAARSQVAQVLATRDREDWLRLFDGHDVCVSPVLTVAQMLKDQQVEARCNVAGVADQEGEVPQFTSPLRMSATPPELRRPAPRVGQHTRELLLETSVQPDEIDRLIQTGVVA
ncbi:CaiB/BaiF CoA-transferase family protein [Ramlibacter sp. AN1015]|uniref:CaiB/BaiF CoA transferase family protein n=1 Tax=Ramlibacter sp. AN1015 TaxID=3133428 RepID=UPI0030C56006